VGIWLSLNWVRCADGIEFISPPKRPRAVQFDAEDHFRWVSDRGAALYHQLTPAKPLAIRFVNSESNEALEDFFGEVGLPHAYAQPGTAWPAEMIASGRRVSAENVRGWQNNFRAQLEHLHAGSVREALDGINLQLVLADSSDLTATVQWGRRDPTPRLNFSPRNLFGFMQMEIAIMAISQSGVSSCEQCGEFFATGSRTGRQARSKFCSARCRVAASRARRKAGG